MRILNHCWMLDGGAPRPNLMERMIQRMGVSPVVAARVDGGMALREARTKCMFCRREDECQDWLGGKTGSGDPREFCPNVAFFQHCAASPVGGLLAGHRFKSQAQLPRWNAHFTKLR
jgi:Family of unknown function (DUF6455)